MTERNGLPEDRADYPQIGVDLVEEIRFRSVAPAHLAAIKERIRNVSRGGVLVRVESRPAVNSIAEIRYRTAANGPLIEAVGLVRWVEASPPAAGIQFVRVSANRASRRTSRVVPKADAPGAPPATTVYAEGPVLYVKGVLGSGAYNGFVSCWAKTLAAPSDRLIIDLTGVTRISSMGVGLLVGAHMDATKQEKSLTIKVPVAFQRLLGVSGMDRVARFVYVDPRGGRVEPDAGDEDEALIGAPPPPADASGETFLDVDEAADPVAEAEAELQRELDNMRKESGGDA
ncbi:MAG: STAS domain-containing protein [Planctomycetota bacterium]